MRPSPRRRHPLRHLCGLWPAVLAVLTLAVAPTLAGRAHAGMRDCMSAPAAAAHTPAGRPRLRDAACAAACALCGQLAAVRVESAAPLRRTVASVAYAVVDRRPAGASPERATPPPR